MVWREWAKESSKVRRGVIGIKGASRGVPALKGAPEGALRGGIGPVDALGGVLRGALVADAVPMAFPAPKGVPVVPWGALEGTSGVVMSRSSNSAHS